MGLSIVACGKQETTATAETIPATVESAQVETTEATTETIESTEAVGNTTTENETSTKKYFYAFRFRVDQNNNIIAVVIEPISMEYWSAD